MRIGIDFDNTLIDYDGVFVQAARERGLIGPEAVGSKRAVRDAIRLLPGGEATWQRLQGYVYGAGIAGAVPFAGARDFLRRCAEQGVELFIVSHKTRYGHFDPARIDLREAARQWLIAQGMMTEGVLAPGGAGIPADHVFFEDDRTCKLARIAALGCTHFIDDLEEVFADPGFPLGVRRVLFAATGAACCDDHCEDWQQISAAIFGLMPRDPGLERAAAAARTLLGGSVDAVERARGFGRNSGVYRIRQGGTSYALKQYPPRRPGERDRAGIELAALRFMVAHGIGSVPRPYAADSERGHALIEWIDGAAVTAPSDADIAAAAGFLAAIHGLRNEPGAAAQPTAAEACLSGGEIVAQIERRLARLSAVAAEEKALAGFLDDAIRPLLARITGWAERGYAGEGVSFTRPIDGTARTLCASDFGFHNALRRPSGELAFIDFDDFGWDDPVKLTADFLLHPGMQLPLKLMRRFAAAAAAIYQTDPFFAARLRLLYPLFSLRWCMILLNEFLPERWAHRINAGGEADWVAVKQRQLDRAQEWVQSLATNFQRFPYGQ